MVRSTEKTQVRASTLRYRLNLQQLTHNPAQGDRQWISISLMRLLSSGSQLVGWARWRLDGDRRDIRILRYLSLWHRNTPTQLNALGSGFSPNTLANFFQESPPLIPPVKQKLNRQGTIPSLVEGVLNGKTSTISEPPFPH